MKNIFRQCRYLGTGFAHGAGHDRHSLKFAGVILISLIFCLFLLPVPAQAQVADKQALLGEEKPANFIFLVDVSGSMVSKSTMVESDSGEKITLFEALRQALKQIVAAPGLIGARSKVCFITFGTRVAEKVDWPTTLDSKENRSALIEKIESQTELQADKHGDTYMAGALNSAYEKAVELAVSSPPCTTTFIIMLTDGWDEPPPHAPLKIWPLAAKIVAKQGQIKSLLGVNTWAVRVIGIKRLPEKKTGTTTASEIAKLIGGEFLDVTKVHGATVSDCIFLALNQTLASLQGTIELPQGKECVPIDFGVVDAGGKASAVIPLQLRSCFTEKITGLSDDSATITADWQSNVLSQLSSIGGGTQRLPKFQLVSSLPKELILVKLKDPECVFKPLDLKQGSLATTSYPLTLMLQAAKGCPPGNYMGCLSFISTANVPKCLPYVVKVPGRLVVGQQTLKLSVRKPGFFFAKGTSGVLVVPLHALVGPHPSDVLDLTLTPGPSSLKSNHTKTGVSNETLPSESINNGKPLTLNIDTHQSVEQIVSLEVLVPAKQRPGTYEGKLYLKLPNSASIAYPSEIPFELVILSSPWEEISPIAVPILTVFLLCAIGGFVLWLSSVRRD